MKTSHELEAYYGFKASRRIVATIGKRYRVSPLNPQKKKHRGRICVLESFDDDFMLSSARARFEDNNRVGKLDLSDLEPLN